MILAGMKIGPFSTLAETANIFFFYSYTSYQTHFFPPSHRTHYFCVFKRGRIFGLAVSLYIVLLCVPALNFCAGSDRKRYYCSLFTPLALFLPLQGTSSKNCVIRRPCWTKTGRVGNLWIHFVSIIYVMGKQDFRNETFRNIIQRTLHSSFDFLRVNAQPRTRVCVANFHGKLQERRGPTTAAETAVSIARAKRLDELFFRSELTFLHVCIEFSRPYRTNSILY